MTNKDKRMDLLLESVQEKDALHRQMLDKVLRCSRCPVEAKNED